MKLVVTIDTEEDNWGDYSADSFNIENIKKIPLIQKLFDDFNVIPTYLITYPVATNKESVRILRRIHQQGKCEIGMHCHPWSTPPFEEERNAFNSMLCNLPYKLQQKKMSVLNNTIKENFSIKATSFRAGRWGYNGDTAVVLKELDYKVDTSITAFTDWSEYSGPNFSEMDPEPYKFNAPEIFQNEREGELTEIPASVGYLQENFNFCRSVDRRLNSRWFKKIHLRRILATMKILNKVLLSPEASNSGQLIALTKIFIKKKYEIINLFFHSTSLLEGRSFFVKSKTDKEQFMNCLKEYFEFTTKAGIQSIKLSESEIEVKL
jgi:hypothetical protein